MAQVPTGELDVLMLVATHKTAEMPSGGMYFPVHVGHALANEDLGYQPDDLGENISALNRAYCELTGVYWAWRNSSSDAVGLSHYRRYFRGDQKGPNGKRVLSEAQARDLLSRYDVVIGRPRHYFIETIEDHYRNGHHGEDLDVLREVVEKMAPDSVDAFESVFRGRSLSLYNMFLMSRDLFEEYAGWLFPILLETTARLGDRDSRTVYQRRTEGYLGERLLNVWVTSRPELRVRHHSIVNVDGERKTRKAVRLLGRKSGLIRSEDRVD